MQPWLNPREWRCNVLQAQSHWNDEVNLRFEDEPKMCQVTSSYRWWSLLDRRIFSVVHLAKSMNYGSYYCPVCERFFSPQGWETHPKLPPPYIRTCENCKEIGTEHMEVHGARKRVSEDL
jgi:hypothetical protein